MFLQVPLYEVPWTGVRGDPAANLPALGVPVPALVVIGRTSCDSVHLADAIRQGRPELLGLLQLLLNVSHL